jgi:hypothetical protein
MQATRLRGVGGEDLEQRMQPTLHSSSQTQIDCRYLYVICKLAPWRKIRTQRIKEAKKYKKPKD